MKQKTNIYVFRKSFFELYFVRYVALIGVIITVAVLEGYWLFSNKAQDIVTLLIVITAFSVIYLSTALLQNKFIFSIIADVDEQCLTLNMFKENKIYKISFKDIEKIYVNFYVTFNFKDKKVIYRGVEETDLIDFLKKQENVVWGFAWKWIAGK